MLRARFINGVFSFHVDLRSIGPIVRGALVLLLDLGTWGMHPSSPYQPILLRNRIGVPL